MGYVTQEMIVRARETHVLDYILSCEAGLYKRVGRGYRHREDSALAVSDKGWYCHRKNKGNVTALDYLVELKGYGLVEAVCMILGEQPIVGPHKTSKVSESSELSKPSSQAVTNNTSNQAFLNKYPNQAVISKSSNHTTNIKPSNHTATRKHPNHAANQPSQATNQPSILPSNQTLALPRRHKDNRRVIAYLQSRGIDRDLMLDCINRGVLYESAVYHNCVFLGKDNHGKTRFAALRSTTNRFMHDAEGSDKRYGFIIPPNDSDAMLNLANNSNSISANNGNSIGANNNNGVSANSSNCIGANKSKGVSKSNNKVALFESPIEALSHQTMCKQGYMPTFDGWRLSLGGTSTLGLEYFLENNPHITHCIVCTNNDEAGNMAMKRIKSYVILWGLL